MVKRMRMIPEGDEKRCFGFTDRSKIFRRLILILKWMKEDRKGGRKEKEGRISERRFTGEARKHTNHRFQKKLFHQ